MDAKPKLSEISHLFLSQVRQRQTSATGRQKRKPPQSHQSRRRSAADASIDMTPEEFAAAMESSGGSASAASASSGESSPRESAAESASGPTAAPRITVSAVIAWHLPDAADRVRQYAAHHAAAGRVCILELDDAAVSATCLDNEPAPSAEHLESLADLDAKNLRQTLAELSFDVHRWLIVVPGSHGDAARRLLQLCPHWVLLSTADHNGVISGYRALKGLDVRDRDVTVGMLDAAGPSQADEAIARMISTAGRFLGCRLKGELNIVAAPSIQEHPLFQCRAAGAWDTVADFLANSAPPEAKTVKLPVPENPAAVASPAIAVSQSPVAAAAPFPAAAPAFPASKPSPEPLHLSDSASSPMRLPQASSDPEIFDLSDATPETVLDTWVRQGVSAGRWVVCPLQIPVMPQAIFAVDRSNRLALITVAAPGLDQLARISQALRWLTENRPLIRLALPQFSISGAGPAVHLLVDQSTASAGHLQSLLASSSMQIHPYRRVRWGQRLGLLLEAA